MNWKSWYETLSKSARPSFLSLYIYNWVRSQVDMLHWSNCWGQIKIVASKPNFQYEYLHLIAPSNPSTFLLLFSYFGSSWVAVLVRSFSQSTNHKIACWKCLGSTWNPSLIIFWFSVDCPVATGERDAAAQVKTGCADGKEIWDREEQPGKESGGIDERAEVGSLPTARYTRFWWGSKCNQSTYGLFWRLWYGP